VPQNGTHSRHQDHIPKDTEKEVSRALLTPPKNVGVGELATHYKAWVLDHALFLALSDSSHLAVDDFVDKFVAKERSTAGEHTVLVYYRQLLHKFVEHTD
jgi:hypothetical protein